MTPGTPGSSRSQVESRCAPRRSIHPLGMESYPAGGGAVWTRSQIRFGLGARRSGDPPRRGAPKLASEGRVRPLPLSLRRVNGSQIERGARRLTPNKMRGRPGVRFNRARIPDTSDLLWSREFSKETAHRLSPTEAAVFAQFRKTARMGILGEGRTPIKRIYTSSRRRGGGVLDGFVTVPRRYPDECGTGIGRSGADLGALLANTGVAPTWEGSNV